MGATDHPAADGNQSAGGVRAVVRTAGTREQRLTTSEDRSILDSIVKRHQSAQARPRCKRSRAWPTTRRHPRNRATDPAHRGARLGDLRRSAAPAPISRLMLTCAPSRQADLTRVFTFDGARPACAATGNRRERGAPPSPITRTSRSDRPARRSTPSSCSSSRFVLKCATCRTATARCWITVLFYGAGMSNGNAHIRTAAAGGAATYGSGGRHLAVAEKDTDRELLAGRSEPLLDCTLDNFGGAPARQLCGRED